MTRDEARKAILDILGEIAPGTDLAALGPTDDLRERLDIDSYDALRFAVRLEEVFGVSIPDSELRRLHTLDDAVSAVIDRSGPSG